MPVTVAVAVGVFVGTVVAVAVMSGVADTSGVLETVTGTATVGVGGTVTRAISIIFEAWPRVTLLFGRK